MFLPWVPSISFGVVLISGNEVDVSLHEVCEGSLRLSLNVQLHMKEATCEHNYYDRLQTNLYNRGRFAITTYLSNLKLSGRIYHFQLCNTIMHLHKDRNSLIYKQEYFKKETEQKHYSIILYLKIILFHVKMTKHTTDYSINTFRTTKRGKLWSTIEKEVVILFQFLKLKVSKICFLRLSSVQNHSI